MCEAERVSWPGGHGQGAVVSSLGTREVLGKGERLEVPRNDADFTMAWLA